jgi:hypothetical protein
MRVNRLPWWKRVLCTLSGHGGLYVAPDGNRWFCKRCGKRVSLL